MSLGALILLSLCLGVAAWLLFLWSVKAGQYEDPEGPKYRMLEDDEAPPRGEGHTRTPAAPEDHPMPSPTPDWIYRRIVENASDAVVFADHDGVIRLWNSGAEAMFGFSAAEAVGQSMDLIIPERLRARHWEGYRRVMKTGATRYGREILAVPAARKDGTSISIEFTIQLVRGDGGEILGPVAIMRDVTARFRRDRELQRRLEDLEARLVPMGGGGGE